MKMRYLSLMALVAFCLNAAEVMITGTVVSDNTKYIGARYLGYVKEVYVELGDEVKREDTLFKLDSAEFDIVKEQANLALEQAEILTDVYRSKLDEIRREKALLRKRKIKDATFDIDDWTENLEITAEHTSAMIDAMQAVVKHASQKVKEVSLLSHYLEVKAPSDGIIIQKNLHVGDMVMPGYPVMILVDLDKLEIEAQISEADIMKINKGDEVDFEIPAIHYKGKGWIKAIVPSANPMTHTFTVRIRFKRRNAKIYPGMYTKVTFHFSDPEACDSENARKI